MYLKLTRSGGHSYLQLLESFRNEEGKPQQRTVATLGRLHEVDGGIDSLLHGLQRVGPLHHSHLGVLGWLETVSVPEVDSASLTHQQLLPSMGALMDHRDAVDAIVPGLLRAQVRHGQGGAIRASV